VFLGSDHIELLLRVVIVGPLMDAGYGDLLLSGRRLIHNLATYALSRHDRPW
jgi:hypothetical protein